MNIDFKILYGVEKSYVDITERALTLCPIVYNNLIIPANDLDRAFYFGDHVPNVLKHILVTTNINDKKNQITTKYNQEIITISLTKIDVNKLYRVGNPIEKLESIHKSLKFTGGSLKDEFPEQIMAIGFIRPDDIVLEIGANIGRNTLIIASILNNKGKNLLTLETDSKSSQILKTNKELNNFQFQIVNAALSKKPLFQKGWNCIQADKCPVGFKPVSIVNYADIANKYTVLVADCEGALYYILQDFPQIFDYLQKIIIENDFTNIRHKETVDKLFKDYNFTLAYRRAGGWGPCQSRFFEVWVRA